MTDYAGALEAIDRILNRGGDADDVLGAVLEALNERHPVRGHPVRGERPAGRRSLDRGLD